jgi:hypothetical protein
VSWQIAPTVIKEMLQDKDPETAERVSEGNPSNGEDRY